MKTRDIRNIAGWTLLEMILALALTTLLLSGIYGAMHVFYRGVNTTRVNVERDQLARTVLRRVSDDLRSAVRYMPADTSGLSGAASGGLADAAAALGAATGNTGSSGSSSTGGSGNSSNSSGSATSGTSGSGSSSSSGSTSTDSAESTETTTAPPIPGVYGTANYLQIDICRLPRPDEIAANASRGTPTSEVRTVSYSMGQGTDGSGLPALIRTEQSRAAALYGSTNGTSADPTTTNTQVLAAEVASVEFLYFDGAEWLPEWDSTAMGSVPLAIDVRVIMRSPYQQAVADEGLVAATAADAVLIDPNSVFRLVVHLPAALTPAGSTGSTTTTDDPAATASTGSGSTTPSSPTSGSGSSSSGSSGNGSSSNGGSKGGSGSSGGTKGGSSGPGGSGFPGGGTGPGSGAGPGGGLGTGGGTGNKGGGTTTPIPQTPPTPPMVPMIPMTP